MEAWKRLAWQNICHGRRQGDRQEKEKAKTWQEEKEKVALFQGLRRKRAEV